MSPEQSQYIWRKTIPHIEVGMGSGVFTSHRSARGSKLASYVACPFLYPFHNNKDKAKNVDFTREKPFLTQLRAGTQLVALARHSAPRLTSLPENNVRLACVKHIASVPSEPGSNSSFDYDWAYLW
ncbi:hypothetical protein ACFE04_019697 [Oxalis oulophora]